MVVESIKKVGTATAKAAVGHVTEGGSINLFFFLVMLAHIADGLYQYNLVILRTATYLTLGILGWFMVFREPGTGFASKEGIEGLIKSIVLAIVAWGLPLALLRLGPSLNISLELLNIVVSVWPFYLVWFVFLEPTTPLLHSIQKLITTVWVIIGIMTLYSAIEAGQLDNIPALHNTENTDMIGAWGNVWQLFKNAVMDLFDTLMGFPKMIREGIERQLEYATGGEYHSGVEEQTVEKLGVFIKDLKPSNPEIKENKSLELWGTLEVKSASDDPLSISISCNSSTSTGTHSISHFIVEGSDDIDIDCIFLDGFKKGSHKINFFATYSFETAAYLKTYFMDEERKKTMRRANLDVFDEFGIKEKEPIARYTSGPIKIGISTSSQPIGLNQEATTKPRVGFTIENTWEGKIKKITSLKITLPKGLELDQDTCDYNFLVSETKENSITYKITKEIDEIKTYRTFNCRTKVTDIISLLGNIPLSTKELSVSAAYIFESEEETKITVK